ncbi:GNAT family N-acetyltransferase [Streptomyces acidiscabies]|uniref:GNAT family N-acetyltransferase n=1 Tax=Streptomyces acidiscabies TaxID=42234 RepID=A0AAP6EI22_9ACTN|nr:GNAT family N-acetyltransferase [Streptomyces acidiscabies]MBP5939641.1 GNAT family N-acetyltransferase [Streptomyces sp. LBUM 1476]MBZ3910812.1 GNAT family N-acetyltransferase [Streptomyces acidiscabies]MDX2963006.1 GNAT family N-acetyltransferase [Streptomyces acidiscabies]MDX3017448.1 GNAT family N-acetyltransferase [Streptomyces acidiscabies]MDX3787924.1 GNAT family N-acetyltransferase [Streptomyces acidiscabies]
MPDEIVIRAAEERELDAVAGLRWRWFEEDGKAAVVEREEFVRGFVAWAKENAGSHGCTVVVRGERVVGMAWVAIVSRVPTPTAPERLSGDVQCVYVVPEERGAGVGGRLLGAVVERARELGVERLTVHSSGRAVPAYVRAGFAGSERLLQVRY